MKASRMGYRTIPSGFDNARDSCSFLNIFLDVAKELENAKPGEHQHCDSRPRGGMKDPTAKDEPGFYTVVVATLDLELAAGSFANYAKAHRARLLAILAPKFPHLPKEMVSVVIGFWAHVGFY